MNRNDRHPTSFRTRVEAIPCRAANTFPQEASAMQTHLGKAASGIATLVGLAVISIFPGAPAVADATTADRPTSTQEVLSEEQAWLDAYASRDSRALMRILAPNFVHINYAGALRDRDDELRSLSTPHLFAEHLSDEVVSFEGPVAIVHGTNEVTQNGRTIARLRFTDVFARRDDAWEAVSAQETPVH
jgi:ketosteroid isomerase-like protein